MDFHNIMLIATVLGTIWLFLYGLKWILDAETYKTITNKIVAYIIKAEQDIQGYKQGAERLNEVVKCITTTATPVEKKFLKRINLPSLVTSIFTGIVTPILFKRK